MGDEVTVRAESPNGRQNVTPAAANDSGAIEGGATTAVLLRAIADELNASARVKQTMANSPEQIFRIAVALVGVLRGGGKVLFCGNGGSAADALHLAAEFVGRYRLERDALPALALSANVSVITAIGNDYAYERVFARQVEALGRNGDAIVAMTTSGASANILRAMEAARQQGMIVIAFTGERGTGLRDIADLTLVVPSADTARIQEGYMAAAHAICGLTERALGGDLRTVDIPALQEQ